MSDLLTRLSAALEFDKKSAFKGSDNNPNNGDYYYSDETFIEGANWQLEQLRPIHKALIDWCKTALAVHDENLDWLRGGTGCPHCALTMVKLGKSLAALEAALREGGT